MQRKEEGIDQAWVQEMLAKSDDLIRKNKLLRQKNKDTLPSALSSTY
jgi:hypothetical protein